MKHFYYILVPLIMIGCEIIPENDQIIPIEQPKGEAAVLLTEFTGQQCVNCPTAAAEADKLHQEYGEQLVVVAMYPPSNPFTRATAQYDYTTTAADEYYKLFGGTSSTPFPTGVINFSRTDGNFFADYTAWGTAIAQQSQKTNQPSLDLQAEIDAEKRQLTVNTQTSEPSTLLLWLTENNVVGPQMMPDGTVNTDYTHNHILREALNGTWGQQLSTQANTAQYTIADRYNIENLTVVALLMNEDKEVLNVKQITPTLLTHNPLILSVNGIGEITHDTTIIVTEVEKNIFTGENEMGINGMLGYNGKLYVDIERENTEVDDQFCCADKCINTDYEHKQELDFTVSGMSQWYTHLTPTDHTDYTLTYVFNSHDTQPLRLTVIYRYE